MTEIKQMPETQKNDLQNMDSGQIMDFQIRLQIQCEMTNQEAAAYIAQAFED